MNFHLKKGGRASGGVMRRKAVHGSTGWRKGVKGHAKEKRDRIQRLSL